MHEHDAQFNECENSTISIENRIQHGTKVIFISFDYSHSTEASVAIAPLCM